MEEGRIEERKKKVMVAIDESECSHYALHWALQNLQDSIANSVLVIFTAHPVTDFSYIYVASYGAVCMSLELSLFLFLSISLYCSLMEIWL